MTYVLSFLLSIAYICLNTAEASPSDAIINGEYSLEATDHERYQFIIYEVKKSKFQRDITACDIVNHNGNSLPIVKLEAMAKNNWNEFRTLGYCKYIEHNNVDDESIDKINAWVKDNLEKIIYAYSYQSALDYYLAHIKANKKVDSSCHYLKDYFKRYDKHQVPKPELALKEFKNLCQQ